MLALLATLIASRHAVGSPPSVARRPAFVDPTYLQAMALLPRTVRVVLVEPSQVTLDETGLGARVAGKRGETAVVAPGCELPEATAAGPAGVARTRYALTGPGATTCYRGGVLVERPGRIEMILVGADDPFRNDRIGERWEHCLTLPEWDSNLQPAG